MSSNAWDTFFGNPLISSYLEEADIQEQGSIPDEQDQASSGADLEQLANDIKQGTIDQDDLISMYKAGKITKDEVSQVMANAEGTPEGEAPIDPETGEPQLSEEELLAQQIDQTNDLFIKFTIYDKIIELNDKLNYFEDNFEDIESEVYQKVIQLKEFLNVLSNLVFNIETAVAYQMYGSILLQLTELFTEYNKKISQEEQTKDIKDQQLKPYRDGDQKTNPADLWAEDNKSDLMPDNGNQSTNDNNY